MRLQSALVWPFLPQKSQSNTSFTTGAGERALSPFTWAEDAPETVAVLFPCGVSRAAVNAEALDGDGDGDGEFGLRVAEREETETGEVAVTGADGCDGSTIPVPANSFDRAVSPLMC